MALFTKKPLGILDRLYGFVGGLAGVRGVDLASDITLVHDVSRETEVNGYGGYNGYLLWQQQLVRSAAATPFFLNRRADVQPALNRTDEEYELWVMEAHTWTTSVSGFTSLFLGVGRDTGSAPVGQSQYAVLIGAQEFEIQSICSWVALTQMEDGLGNSRFTCSTHRPVNTTYVLPQFQPVRVPPGGFVEWLLNTSAAHTLEATVRLWVGPLGARPPGIA